MKAERERLLSQQNDDYRARALQDMMNGKLDDRYFFIIKNLMVIITVLKLKKRKFLSDQSGWTNPKMT